MDAGRLAPSADVAPDAFVGRRQELKSLGAVLGGGRTRPRLVVIRGQAGIGKTRLATELLEQARQASTRVLQCSCYQIQEAGPYHPIRQIISQLHQNAEPDEFIRTLADKARGRRKLDQLSQDVRGRRAQFLSALSNSIAREAATEESVLLVEDIQWADVGSLLVLNNLLDARPVGLSIVCTLRPEEGSDADVRHLITRIERRSRRIVLRGLLHEDARQLVENIVGLGRITAKELQALHAFTRGNPMLIQEFLLYLEDSDLLDQHSIQEAIAHVPAPHGLSHFIGLRLDSLPERVLRVLSGCSVVATNFAAEFVTQISGEPLASTQDCLQVAMDRGILQVEGTLAPGRYRFAHPLFAKILYDSLSPTDRRVLHQRIAAIAESDNTLPIDDLARHHALGFGHGAGRKAIEYCKAAAEEAEQVLAYEKSADFWGLALTCTPPRSRRQRAELYWRQGWALWAAGKWDQAAEVWTKAVHSFAALGQRAREAEVSLALGDICRWRLELTEAEGWLEHGLSLAPATQPERGRALAQLGGIRHLLGGSDASRLLEEAECRIRAEGYDPIAAYWLSNGLRLCGNHSRAHAVAKSGLRHAQHERHSSAAGLLAASLVNYELSRLDAKAARSHVRIGKRVAQEHDPTALINARAAEALFLGYSGKWDQVAKTCEQWMAQVRLASKFQIATARMFWAEAKLALGDYAAAEHAMLLSLPDMGEMKAVASLHLARAQVRLGSKNEAAIIAHQDLPSLVKSPRATVAAGRAILGDVASSVDEPRLWRTCYRLLELEPSPVVMAYAPVSVQRVLGRLAGRLGLWKESFAHFDTAVRQLAHGNAYSELAQTYLDYSETREARGRRGDANKAAALELKAGAVLKELGIPLADTTRAVPLSKNGNRFGLSPREIEVLALVAKGRRSREIAEVLSVSTGTVNRHVENIFGKMNVSNRAAAVMRGVEQGLIMRNGDKDERL